MLRISRRADYALRTMVAIAQAASDEYISTPDIGERMLIPQPFLVKVIGDLKRSGLIRTAVGRKGGVALARPPGKITLRHIVEAVEGPVVITECLIEPGQCPRGAVCPAHEHWMRIQQTLRDELDAVSLEAIAGQRDG
ncbi:MAG: Rrf2 family transcriptional regulator [Aggregatilineales bacterium]|jgi:Rrf2 family iron-sulfur cluster assembly transcriptional regulator|nr:Rrf2 family transcriptional regulator [Chloroflexota bacterium]HOA25259.1 Rrf2 family transcriptional regulator [Aggregatilineales bacterium]HPV07445.1 Rrf2 family transcriptional regulator [Aggregatilineales bacterium]HQE18310.1 Rrf2 family transcriptional regulator [Aggregatilineales bacterium]